MKHHLELRSKTGVNESGASAMWNVNSNRYVQKISVLCGVVSLLLSACSSEEVDGRPQLFEVRGTVLQGTSPVDGATVVFIPVSHPYAAAGVTDQNGQFRLTTFNANDGAAAGDYQVTVKKFYFVGDVEHQLLPVRYSNTEESGFTAQVQEGGKNQMTFALEKQ